MNSFYHESFAFNGIKNRQVSFSKPKNLAIAWVDLNFFEPKFFGKRKPKRILCGVSGSIDFGTLTALMGPSGAGKTTLLKCLNGYQMNDIEGCSQIYLSR